MAGLGGEGLLVCRGWWDEGGQFDSGQTDDLAPEFRSAWSALLEGSCFNEHNPSRQQYREPLQPLPPPLSGGRVEMKPILSVTEVGHTAGTTPFRSVMSLQGLHRLQESS